VNVQEDFADMRREARWKISYRGKRLTRSNEILPARAPIFRFPLLSKLRNQLSHNYIRPHMALKGKTPAEAAGIKVEGKNKWLTLIQNASKR